MREDYAALLNLLRCELDATNQQFVHILALICLQQASAAAERCEHTGIARLCSDSAAFLRTLASWQPDTPHPAVDSNPSVFNSFEATLSRFIS